MPVQRIFSSIGQDGFASAGYDAECFFDKYISSKLTMTMLDAAIGHEERRSLLQAFRARRLVLLVDGVDEASKFATDIELFVRKCVSIGVRVVVTSRPEGIRDTSVYKRQLGWEVLGLPELTTKQQNQIVETVVGMRKGTSSSLETFFRHLFSFSASREQYDIEYRNLPVSDRNWLEGKMVTLHGRESDFQEASDGKSVDEGLLRENLKNMQSHLDALLKK
jgi:hypothetical protein